MPSYIINVHVIAYDDGQNKTSDKLVRGNGNDSSVQLSPTLYDGVVKNDRTICGVAVCDYTDMT